MLLFLFLGNLNLKKEVQRDSVVIRNFEFKFFDFKLNYSWAQGVLQYNISSILLVAEIFRKESIQAQPDIIDLIVNLIHI